MELPKPRVMPVSYSYNSSNKDTISMILATTYTATAMFEQFSVSTKILEGINLLNSNFVKMMELLQNNEKNKAAQDEENNSEKKPNSPDDVKLPEDGGSDLLMIIGGIKKIIMGSVALIGVTIISLLDDSKKAFVKGILAMTLAVGNYYKEIIQTTSKLMRIISFIFQKMIRPFEILNDKIFNATTSAIKFLVHRIDWLGKSVRYIGLSFLQADDFIRNLKLPKFLEPVKDLFMKIKGPLMKIGGWIGTIARQLGSVVSTVAESAVLKSLKVFAPIFKLGLSKLLWPIQLVLSICDFVDGFMEEYAKKGSVVDSIEAGLNKVFEGFFGGIVGLVDWAITAALKKLGLENTAAEFTKNLNKNWDSIKKIFSGILDIFAGVLTLDVKKIWKGLGTTASGVGEFFINNIIGAFNIFNALLKDLTGVDIKQKVSEVFTSFGNEAIRVIKSLFKTIADHLTATARSIVEHTVGEATANYMFGAKIVTKEDIEEEALKIAQSRQRQANRKYIDKETNIKPGPLQVLPEDRENAIKQLKENGAEISPELTTVKPLAENRIQSVAKNINKMVSDDKRDNASPTLFNNTINNNGNNNGGQRTTVAIVPQSDRASSASPMNRNYYLGYLASKF